jgi:hypothetical protein
MSFKTVYIAHCPDADPEKHRSVIETGKCKSFTVLVQNQAQAMEVVSSLIRDEGINAVLLCPGFAHKDVAEIAELAGKDISVSVGRGDGPSIRVVQAILKKEGWY